MDLTTDYLVAGAGAVGMAFVDTLLAETGADVVLVDRHAQPGGHWNLAYPFVTLHQPSSFYGVASRELSHGHVDEVGLNRGLADLATGAEVSAYFDHVLRHTFLPSGRVRWFPRCEWTETGFRSLVSGEQWQVDARRAVDATWLTTTVPSAHTPSFSIAGGVRLVPPNALPTLEGPAERFVVIGGGKTGIDACLWLLAQGLDPSRITWVVSRDAWLLDRRNAQPDASFFFDTMGAQAGQLEALAAASTVEDVFDRLERAGVLLRLDPGVSPSMFHAATISKAELDELRRIRDVVRRGHVRAIEAERIVLEGGALPTGPGVVHVDCSASAITRTDTTPVFAGDRITPQTVRPYQPAFSASFVAHVEACYGDEADKNRLAKVVPLPDTLTDFLRMNEAAMLNQYAWSQDEALRSWVTANRLDGFGHLVRGIGEDQPDKRAVLDRMRAAAVPAMVNLQRLLAG